MCVHPCSQKAYVRLKSNVSEQRRVLDGLKSGSLEVSSASDSQEISPVMAGNAVVKSPVLRSPVVKLESLTVRKVNSLINSTKLPYLHVVKHLPLIHKYLLLNTGLGITAKYPLLPSTLA